MKKNKNVIPEWVNELARECIHESGESFDLVLFKKKTLLITNLFRYFKKFGFKQTIKKIRLYIKRYGYKAAIRKGRIRI